MKRLTLNHLQAMKNNQKIAMVTLYDATFAEVASEAGVDIVFIGDSLGMVLKGEKNTLNVSVDELEYHTRCVANGNLYSVVLTDLPFMSYATPDIAAQNAKVLFQAGAEIVKIEGGEWLCETVHFLTVRGMPVCAHIGLTPQFLHTLGGFKVQGRNQQNAQEILQAAIALEEAGAHMILVECIPHQLAQIITEAVQIPVIGIGAGPYCDGQVLVLHDLLGITPGKTRKFDRNFLLNSENGIQGALKNYVTAVKDNSFPTLEESFE